MTAPGYTAESPWSGVLNNLIGLLTKYGMSNQGNNTPGNYGLNPDWQTRNSGAWA